MKQRLSTMDSGTLRFLKTDNTTSGGDGGSAGIGSIDDGNGPNGLLAVDNGAS